MPESSKFNFKTPAELRVEMIQKAGAIGLMAENFFRQSFRDQGFTDKVFIPWKKRQGGKRTRTFGDGGKISGRAILVKTGNLRRSIYRTQASSGNDFVLTFKNEVPYAAAHNDGFKGPVAVSEYSRRLFSKQKTQYVDKSGKNRNTTVKVQRTVVKVKAHTRNMNIPRRRFIGESLVLSGMIEKELLKTELTKR